MAKKIRSGEAVIKSMVRLLNRRYTRDVDRKGFMVRWLRLRRELRATVEYRQFSYAVRVRARGLCEDCGCLGDVVHHVRPVARAPMRALDVDNAQLLCIACHVRKHPHMAKVIARDAQEALSA